MSLEIHAFIRVSDIPGRSEWQNSIRSLGLPLELDEDLDPLNSSGFVPCVIADHSSGFEIYLDSADDLLASYPNRREEFSQYDKAISFRWGGHMEELACGLASAAALVDRHGARVYYPADDLVYEREVLLQEAKDVINSLNHTGTSLTKDSQDIGNT